MSQALTCANQSEMAKYLMIDRWTNVRDADGNLIDIKCQTIRHTLSYCEWNEEKKDWDYIINPCSCIICKEELKN